MAVLDVVRRRYSVRSYLDKPVEKAKLESILDAARLAPSAKNFQEWRFVVVQDSVVRQRLMVAANNQSFVGQAPVVMVCCANQAEYVMRCGQLAYPIDVAIAMEHMALQAVEEGLGTCWIGSFYEDQVKKVLGIPAAVRVVELMALGYPADKQRAANRLPMADIVSHDRWGFGG